jgi:putative intracellular protease/amidase
MLPSALRSSCPPGFRTSAPTTPANYLKDGVREFRGFTVSIALLESFYNSGKPIALVCHSPGVLRHVTHQGAPLVKGKRVTGFTNGEEEEMRLTNIVPFLVEDELMRLGAIFEKKADWQPFSVVDGRLITGQNPASSTVAAQNVINLLAAQKAA